MDSIRLLTKLDTQTLRDWPTILSFLSILLLLYALTSLTKRRPHLPSNTPPLFKASDWPILGSLRFFTDRYRFYNEGILSSKTGNFSFFFLAGITSSGFPVWKPAAPSSRTKRST